MRAEVFVNPDRVISEVSAGIFGSFIENLGACIYGGVYDPGSPAADEDGFRMNVIETAKKMGVTSVRFPGGCYAPYYHFEDGIGPKEQRPKTRYRTHYDNPDNSFGTDEYIKWCRKIGAEPFICINMGTGTPEEARNWVEYCNGSVGSRYADQRWQNGHKEPHGVRLWGIGNEVGGNWELGYFDHAGDYVRRAREFAMAMKEADPSIKLIGCGAHFPVLDGIYDAPTGYFPNPSDNWNREVLDRMFEYLDYIDLHHYIGHDYKDDIMQTWEKMGTEKVHYYLNEQMQILEDAYRIMREDIRLIRHKHGNMKPIGIALDEYNPWYRADENICCNYTAADGLLAAAYFNIFIRNADVAVLCNMAQLVNVLPAVIVEPGGGRSFRTAVSYVQELFLPNKGLEAVDIWVQSPTWEGAYYKEVPYLDASCSYDREKKRLVLNLVNRHIKEDVTVSFGIKGKTVGAISGKFFGNTEPDTENDLEQPNRLSLKEFRCTEPSGIVIPPLSAAVLNVELI